MKRTFFYYVFMALAVMTLASACDKDDFDADYPSDEIEYDGSRKILVAYFSATGNTQRRAEEIVAATGADVIASRRLNLMPRIPMTTATVFRTNRTTTCVPASAICLKVSTNTM